MALCCRCNSECPAAQYPGIVDIPDECSLDLIEPSKQVLLLKLLGMLYYIETVASWV